LTSIIDFDRVQKTEKENEMEIELIEYVRKSGRKPKRDEDGKIIVKGSGVGRQKKGVLYCTPNADFPDTVMVGFSLCSPLDTFDYVNGQHEPGFGLSLAKQRAEKWYDFTGYFVQNTWTEEMIEDGDELLGFVNPDTKSIVEVPPSILKPLKDFIKRCRRYYQDKEFPVWIENIEKDQPEQILESINYTLEIEWGE
jgi:hypothetical protein